MEKSDSISLDDLAIAAEVTTRTIKHWSKKGLPVTQRGRAPSGPGDQAVPWIFPRAAALEWIADHQREIRERNRSPYADVLDKRDPRYTRARQRAQKINDDIARIAATFVSRPDAYRVAHEQFETVKNAVFALPKKLGDKIAKLTDRDRQEVVSKFREEIASATAGLVAKNILPSAPSIIPPDLEDEEDEMEVSRLPRLHESDPRHKVVSLLNEREDWHRSIACGDLIETSAAMDSLSEILGVAKGLLAPIGGRLAQQFGGTKETQREVKTLIDDAIHATYDKFQAMSDLDVDTDDEL